MQRKTTQDLLPLTHKPTKAGQYDIYPAFPLGTGKIGSGYAALAARIAGQSQVIIDGYGGVFWEDLVAGLDGALRELGVTAVFHDIRAAYRAEDEINAIVAPFLGGDDPIFGTRFTGTLADFLDPAELPTSPQANQLTILYGPGAALANWPDATLIYVDLPKNEIQFRARAGSITNLGCAAPDFHKKMYKRFYFVDWIALNEHKRQLLPRIDILVDGQQPETPPFISGAELRAALSEMGRNFFRVRPWFEPGAWGGHWIEQQIPQLPGDVPNYAWSFELIVPENGLLVESDGRLLEFSFDFLMFHDHEAVLGHGAPRFQYEFPIRFDFLDTFAGGNLSLQCHPRPPFISHHFGETYTQDETYYILDAEEDAVVYLGFQDGVNPREFRDVLEKSFAENVPVDVPRYVQVHPAQKHDLFLIPNGTIHCSGTNNMVLEISATPYIFTFKMYDWLRLDLDGRPRPLNIDRAFENLRFELQGDVVTEELLSKPQQIAEGDGWTKTHLPTHWRHFYDVVRYEIAPGAAVSIPTGNSPQVMSLVEGKTVLLRTKQGMEQPFNYAETFVVPAAADTFQLINNSSAPIMVVIAFIKKNGI